MITKWFIQHKTRKSFGYFKEFKNYYGWRTKRSTKPTYSKQTALAKSFNTKEDAEEHLGNLEKQFRNRISDIDDRLNAINKCREKWATISDDKKIVCINDYNLIATYTDRGYGYGFTSYVGYGINRRAKKYSELNDKEKQAINIIDWDKSAESPTAEKSAIEERLKELENLVPRECQIEIKFKDNERKQIRWTVRDDNETSWDYCNGCGGAVPGIAQLKIGWEVTLCAICIGKLLQEAQTQAEKVPEEILEHYETDRFLRKI